MSLQIVKEVKYLHDKKETSLFYMRKEKKSINFYSHL